MSLVKQPKFIKRELNTNIKDNNMPFDFESPSWLSVESEDEDITFEYNELKNSSTVMSESINIECSLDDNKDDSVARYFKDQAEFVLSPLLSEQVNNPRLTPSPFLPLPPPPTPNLDSIISVASPPLDLSLLPALPPTPLLDSLLTPPPIPPRPSRIFEKALNTNIDYIHPKKAVCFEEDLDFINSRSLENESKWYELAHRYCPNFIFSTKQNYYDLSENSYKSTITSSLGFTLKNSVQAFFSVRQIGSKLQILYTLDSLETNNDPEFVLITFDKGADVQYVPDTRVLKENLKVYKDPCFDWKPISIFYSMLGDGQTINISDINMDIVCYVNLQSAAFCPNMNDNFFIKFNVNHNYTKKIKPSVLTLTEMNSTHNLFYEYGKIMNRKISTTGPTGPRESYGTGPTGSIGYGTDFTIPHVLPLDETDDTFWQTTLSPQPSQKDFYDRCERQEIQESTSFTEPCMNIGNQDKPRIEIEAIKQLTNALENVLTKPGKKMMLFYIDL